MNHNAHDEWTRAAYRAVESVEQYSERAAAKRLRVSQATYHRWKEAREKRVPVSEPRGATRAVLIRFMNQEAKQSLSVTASDSGAEASQPYDMEGERKELRRIGSIADPLLRILERESLAAVIRAQGVREAAWAARLEGEAAQGRTAERGRLVPGVGTISATDPATRGVVDLAQRGMLSPGSLPADPPPAAPEAPEPPPEADEGERPV